LRGLVAQATSLCQISSELVNSLDIAIFQKAIATILDFRNHKILFADRARRPESHHRAKLCQNPSMRCGDIALF